MKSGRLIRTAVFLIILARASSAQWVHTGVLDGGNINDIIVRDSYLYAATSMGHVFISTNMGSSWTNFSSGLANYRNISSLAVSGRYLFAATSEIGMFRLTDSNLPWMEANKGLSNIHVFSLASNDSAVFAGTYGGGVFVSHDFGSWSPSNDGLTDSTVYTLLLSGDRLFAGTANGLFISINRGKNWKKAGTELNGKAVLAVAECAGAWGGKYLFASTAGNGIFLSSDSGATWSPRNNGLPSLHVNDVVSFGTKLYCATSAGIFCTSDYGGNWTNISDGIPTGGIETIFSCFNVFDKFLFAGNVLSVWKRPLSEITAVDEGPDEYSPGEFMLGQNYPNPFNPSTRVNYAIPKEASVSLRVFNTLGEEVALIVNEQKPPGLYQAAWNANVPSGIYFYRLSVVPSARRDLVPTIGRDGQAGEFVETKKMLLVK